MTQRAGDGIGTNWYYLPNESKTASNTATVKKDEDKAAVEGNVQAQAQTAEQEKPSTENDAMNKGTSPSTSHSLSLEERMALREGSSSLVRSSMSPGNSTEEKIHSKSLSTKSSTSIEASAKSGKGDSTDTKGTEVYGMTNEFLSSILQGATLEITRQVKEKFDAEMSEMRADLNKNMDEKVEANNAKWIKTKEEQDGKLYDLTKKVDDQKHQIAELEKSNVQLNETVGSQKRELEKLGKKVDKQKHQITELTASNLKLSEVNVSLTKDKAELDAKVSILQEKANKRKSIIAELNVSRNELSKKFAEEERAGKDLRVKVSGESTHLGKN